MAAHGVDSIAFCVDQRTPVSASFEAQGTETISYVPIGPSYRRPRPFVENSMRLAREFRRRRVNLVHCSDLLAAYHAAFAAWLAGIPAICHVRCEYSDLSRRDQLILRFVTRFVFVSNHTRATFAYKHPAHRARVLYDGIQAGRQMPDVRDAVRTELGIPANAAVVGMVARVAPIKDFPTLIRAATRVIARRPDAYFVVVGDTSGAATYRAHFREVQGMIEAAQVGHRFVFTGFRDDVERVVAAMDVATLVTHSEGLPLVLLEAMAQGLPVVATAVGGIPEIVIPGVSGLLHEHQNDSELADALLGLLDDPCSARALGDRAAAFVREHFGQSQFVQDLAQIYHELASPNGIAG